MRRRKKVLIVDEQTAFAYVRCVLPLEWEQYYLSLVSIGKFVGCLVHLTYGKILWRRFEGDKWRFSRKPWFFNAFGFLRH